MDIINMRLLNAGLLHGAYRRTSSGPMRANVVGPGQRLLVPGKCRKSNTWIGNDDHGQAGLLTDQARRGE